MTLKRIVPLDWIAELGRAPRTDRRGSRQSFDFQSISSEDRAEEARLRETIQTAVRKALAGLTDDEREFVERFYYMGAGYAEIAERSGREMHKLEALHRRALRKLRKELASFVKERFQVGIDELPSECPLCNSPFRPQIDLLIAHKAESETWSGVIREIREKFGVRIKTPQLLIGHKKYH